MKEAENCQTTGPRISCQNLTNHARRLYAGQLLFQPLERIGELTIVESQHVQHGGVQVADVHGVFYDFIPHLVSLPVCDSILYSAASQPDGESAWIVVAAYVLHLLSVAIFSHRRPAKLTAPHQERV